MQRRFTEANIWISRNKKGAFFAAPKGGHVQFFVKSQDYDELQSLLKDRMEQAENSNPDILFNIDYSKLYADYENLNRDH